MEKAVEIILKKGLVKAAARAGRSRGRGRSGHMDRARRQAWRHGRDQLADRLRVARRRFQGLRAQRRSGREPGRAQAPTSGTLKFPGTDKTVEARPPGARRQDGENIASSAAGGPRSQGAGGFVLGYVHAGGKLAVLASRRGRRSEERRCARVCRECGDAGRCHEPARRPAGDLRPPEIAKQKEIFAGQLKEEAKPKPEASWPKIIEGKLASGSPRSLFSGRRMCGIPRRGASTSSAKS